MALKEVSCKILNIFFTSLKENNIPLEIMTIGIPYDINYLLNKKESIEWSSFCQIVSNIRSVKDDDEYFVGLGIQLVEEKVYPLISMLAGFFVNAKDIYKMINDPKKGIGHAHAKCIVPSTKEIEDGHLEVKLELYPGYQNCREFFLITKGFFIAVPLLVKLKPSKVLMQETHLGAIYNISYPIGHKSMSWAKSIFSLSSSKRTAINEVNEAYEMLYDRYHELEESKARIQLQAKQLEIAYSFGQTIGGNLNLENSMKNIANSLLNIEELEAVELNVSISIDNESVNRNLKLGTFENKSTLIRRKLESRKQYLGEINFYLIENSNIEHVNQLLDFIVPTISMELFSTISYKLLNDYRAELERKVTDRTKQLHKTNRALTESLSKLKDLKHARDSFFAAISHEFRTPLTLIMGPVEKIIANSPEAEIKKKAEIIQRNANRMLALVNQLLDLSKLDFGKLKLKVTKRNIVDFVRVAFYSFESLAESNQIILKLTSTDERVELHFDGEVMMKIITNLLSNAFKFTDAGGTITIHIVKINNDKVQIKIKDSGIGIPENELPKLFDRFYQVDQSLTRKYEGSGIGLALTRELVELHHGKIFVESKPRISEDKNSGWTEFRLEFPLGVSHFEVDEILKDESQLKNVPESNYLNKKIFFSSETMVADTFAEYKTIVLVVEDNTDLREMIKENLQDTYSILEAENGVKGFKLAEENIPDLIISDIMMPEMDGYELTKKIKTNEKTNHIPVILLTAKAATEDKLEGLETGADDYLIKPFNEKELSVRVRNLIKIRQQMREKYLAQSLVKPGSVVVPSSQKVFVEKLTSIVDKNISNESFSVEVLCKEIGMSRTQLHRKIKSLTNQSTTEFIRNYRLQLAAELLKQDAGNIAEISNKVGFGSQAYFTKLFQELYGLTPLEYKKQHGK